MAQNSHAHKEIVSVRVVDFPQEDVFELFSNPNKLVNWWGPNGFTNTFKTFEFRKGGKWSFIMHGPDGKDFPNEWIFVEIAPGKRIVADHLDKPQFRAEFEFEQLESRKTRIVFRMVFPTVELYNSVKSYAPEKNEENFDRLENELLVL